MPARIARFLLLESGSPNVPPATADPLVHDPMPTPLVSHTGGVVEFFRQTLSRRCWDLARLQCAARP